MYLCRCLTNWTNNKYYVSYKKVCYNLCIIWTTWWYACLSHFEKLLSPGPHMWQMIWEYICMYCRCLLILDMTVDQEWAPHHCVQVFVSVSVCVCGGGSEYTALMSPNIGQNGSSRLQLSYPYFYFLATSLLPIPLPHFTTVCMYKRCNVHSNGVILDHLIFLTVHTVHSMHSLLLNLL